MQGYSDAMSTIVKGERAKPWQGRLIFWGGGIVWIGNAAAQTGCHQHHAIQVSLVLDGGQIRLRSEGAQWQSYQAAIVAANAPHAFEANERLVALIFVEPESRAGWALRQRYRAGIAGLDLPGLEHLCHQLASLYRVAAPDAALAACARTVAVRLAEMEAAPARPLDRRIALAIRALQERISGAIAMADIAATVHLSPERFRHLFLQETGVRFRPYILWLRMEVANAAYAAGSNLTEASHAGGFADSAHFSRTFRRMFGVPAVAVGRAPHC